MGGEGGEGGEGGRGVRGGRGDREPTFSDLLEDVGAASRERLARARLLVEVALEVLVEAAVAVVVLGELVVVALELVLRVREHELHEVPADGDE